MRKLLLGLYLVAIQKQSVWGKTLGSDLGSAAHEMHDPYANHISPLPHPQNRANIRPYPYDTVIVRIKSVYPQGHHVLQSSLTLLFPPSSWCLGGKPWYSQVSRFPLTSSQFCGILDTPRGNGRAQGKWGLHTFPIAAPCQATDRQCCHLLPKAKLVLRGTFPQLQFCQFLVPSSTSCCF